MKTAVLTALVVLTLIGSNMAQVEQSRAAVQGPTHHLSHKQAKHLIATARTAEDHRELAQYFRWEADKMKKDEQYHMEMAAIYRLHPLPYDSKQTVHMQGHCKYFADKARDAAVAAEEMASVHERIADQIVQSGQPYSAAPMNQSSSAAPAAPQRLTGVISDDICRQKHMMPGHSEADCTRACVKAGVKYALVTEDKVYVLRADPQQIEKFVGQTVSVTGEVKKAPMSVQSISEPK
jgi:hypothetical protein